MAASITPLSELDTYIKRLNRYLQEHYPANKKITSEEWNALFLALMQQGNLQEETLERICNSYLPLQIEKINILVNTANDHESRIAQLRTDADQALEDARYAVNTADTALNRVTEKAGTVAYVNGVITPTLEYDTDPQEQLDNHTSSIANLQSQIDLMEQNTNVSDVVGTFAALAAYDKSKITENDIIEVLQDETRENADTYYRLQSGSWVYIGSLGSYYTKGESNALLNNKVSFTDYPTNTKNGVVRILETYGIQGLSNGMLAISKASEPDLINKADIYRPVVASNLDIAVREGLGNSILEWPEVYKENARKTLGIDSLPDPTTKADVDASNLSAENVVAWNNKLAFNAWFVGHVKNSYQIPENYVYLSMSPWWERNFTLMNNNKIRFNKSGTYFIQYNVVVDTSANEFSMGMVYNENNTLTSVSAPYNSGVVGLSGSWITTFYANNNITFQLFGAGNTIKHFSVTIFKIDEEV